jgi:hypothetical protein
MSSEPILITVDRGKISHRKHVIIFVIYHVYIYSHGHHTDRLHKVTWRRYLSFRIIYHIKLYDTTMSNFSDTQNLEVYMSIKLISLMMKNYGTKCSPVSFTVSVRYAYRYDNLRFDLLKRRVTKSNGFTFKWVSHTQQITSSHNAWQMWIVRVPLIKEMQAYERKKSQRGKETERKWK